MKKQIASTFLVILGALWYSFLFWESDMGVNTLLFTLFVVGILFLLHPDFRSAPTQRIMAGATLLGAFSVTWQGTFMAKFVYWLSFILLIGYAQRRELRFLLFAFLLGAGSIFSAPVGGLREWSRTSGRKQWWPAVMHWGRLIVLPSLLGIIFFALYTAANTEFASFFEPLGQWLDGLLDLEWAPRRLLHLIWGALLVGALVWPAPFGGFFTKVEDQQPDNLQRRRRKWLGFVSFSTLALKRYYWSAILSLGLLNGLLLLLNLTDLRYVWMDLSEKSPQQLSQYVHEGTYVLILSILVAMLVLLAFFYRNLNFYPDNHLLKQLAYVWIAQNAVLALSVGIRNWRYLTQYGLTHRRIGVLIFLALVLYGLWTVYGKIAHRRSMFFLLRKNAWSLFVCLLLPATVNWDLVITRYNLWRPAREGIDTLYLLRDLSHQNLYILAENREWLERHAKDPNVKTDYWLGEKRSALRKRLAGRDWRGWNVVDSRAVGRGQ